MYSYTMLFNDYFSNETYSDCYYQNFYQPEFTNSSNYFLVSSVASQPQTTLSRKKRPTKPLTQISSVETILMPSAIPSAAKKKPLPKIKSDMSTTPYQNDDVNQEKYQMQKVCLKKTFSQKK